MLISFRTRRLFLNKLLGCSVPCFATKHDLLLVVPSIPLDFLSPAMCGADPYTVFAAHHMIPCRTPHLGYITDITHVRTIAVCS